MSTSSTEVSLLSELKALAPQSSFEITLDRSYSAKLEVTDTISRNRAALSSLLNAFRITGMEIQAILNRTDDEFSGLRFSRTDITQPCRQFVEGFLSEFRRLGYYGVTSCACVEMYGWNDDQGAFGPTGILAPVGNDGDSVVRNYLDPICASEEMGNFYARIHREAIAMITPALVRPTPTGAPSVGADGGILNTESILTVQGAVFNNPITVGPVTFRGVPVATQEEQEEQEEQADPYGVDHPF